MKFGFQKHPENINKNGRPSIKRKVEIIECACGCGEQFNKYDSRNRVRKYIKFHQSRAGLCRKNTKTSDKARENLSKSKIGTKSKAHYEKIGLKGLMAQQNSKEPTSIEIKLYEELEARHLSFEAQKLINGKFLVDAYIPKLNLVIEVDGDYWHSLDRVVKKDKAENAYLKKCGYDMIRLSELEINSGVFINILNIKGVN